MQKEFAQVKNQMPICVIDEVCDKRHVDVPKSKLREVVNA